MMYRIEMRDRYSEFATGKADLLRKLNELKNETITDIRQVYKSGVSCTIADKGTWKNYIRSENTDCPM